MPGRSDVPAWDVLPSSSISFDESDRVPRRPLLPVSAGVDSPRAMRGGYVEQRHGEGGSVPRVREWDVEREWAGRGVHPISHELAHDADEQPDGRAHGISNDSDDISHVLVTSPCTPLQHFPVWVAHRGCGGDTV